MDTLPDPRIKQNWLINTLCLGNWSNCAMLNTTVAWKEQQWFLEEEVQPTLVEGN